LAGDGPRFDADYWRAFRVRARRRASSQVLLFLIGPIGIVVAILRMLEPMGYPAGDLRNSIEFRLLTYGLAIAFDIGLMVLSARWLLADHSRSH
jgi:hypothetical protein